MLSTVGNTAAWIAAIAAVWVAVMTTIIFPVGRRSHEMIEVITADRIAIATINQQILAQSLELDRITDSVDRLVQAVSSLEKRISMVEQKVGV